MFLAPFPSVYSSPPTHTIVGPFYHRHPVPRLYSWHLIKYFTFSKCSLLVLKPLYPLSLCWSFFDPSDVKNEIDVSSLAVFTWWKIDLSFRAMVGQVCSCVRMLFVSFVFVYNFPIHSRMRIVHCIFTNLIRYCLKNTHGLVIKKISSWFRRVNSRHALVGFQLKSSSPPSK